MAVLITGLMLVGMAVLPLGLGGILRETYRRGPGSSEAGLGGRFALSSPARPASAQDSSIASGEEAFLPRAAGGLGQHYLRGRGTLTVTAFTGTIDVSGQNPGSTLVPPVRGTVTPAAIAFGDQRVGTTSAARTVTITNTGSAPLVVSSFTVTGTNAADYALTTPATPFNIPINGSQTFTVTFAPSAAGGSSATVNVGTNDAATPTKTVALTGNGTVPTIAVTPASVTFADTR